MFTNHFDIEVEFTGITRCQAAKVAAKYLDGSNHTPRSIRNFVNIIASHNDLFYKALQIEPERMRYCKKMDT